MLESADKVARFLLGVAAKPLPDPELRIVEINGGPAVLVLSRGLPDSVVSVEATDGLITEIHVMRNPTS